MRKRLLTQRFVVSILLAVVVSSILLGCQRNQSVEIIIPKEAETVGAIFIDGAVSVPGYYPLRSKDTLEGLIQSAGGTTQGADLSHLKLYIPRLGEEEKPQRIDINRAEAWLLEALPGVGEGLAQRIVAYRKTNGLFRNINELTRVEGIGAVTLSEIRELITISD